MSVSGLMSLVKGPWGRLVGETGVAISEIAKSVHSNDSVDVAVAVETGSRIVHYSNRCKEKCPPGARYIEPYFSTISSPERADVRLGHLLLARALLSLP